MQVALKEHEWTLMTMTQVDVVGEDPEGAPFGIPTGETQEGVNCRKCGEPYPSDEPCEDDA